MVPRDEDAVIEYSFEKSIDPQSLHRLLQQTAWAKERSFEDFRVLLKNSSVILGAWEGDRLVGFARALSDERCRALIDDVIVDASERGRKIGDQLMKRLLERLSGIEEIILLCEKEVAPFYDRYGFKKVTGETLKLKRP